jgi:hypothetical protein
MVENHLRANSPDLEAARQATHVQQSGAAERRLGAGEHSDDAGSYGKDFVGVAASESLRGGAQGHQVGLLSRKRHSGALETEEHRQRTS